ncbi:hypothetical protein GOP47_0021449 [Adiantum capillus-veneris]|uniref:Uncharacterized protein n=1 Tax=Adiantum capillus-veneris TaxID=13818 RepID=A0A9D4Z6Y9_ADICA|nr:hypothetical protein GOP47_0021449 [Adiantum capillus-veneris]
MPGSKILVTSRSKEILKRVLLNSNDVIVHVPSMNEEDAVEALISYSCLPINMLPSRHQLTRLARSCFIGELCYPLFVKERGFALREQGREWLNDADWESVIRKLQVGWDPGIGEENRLVAGKEDLVMQVLQKSFDRLTPKLQEFFSDLVTCCCSTKTSMYGRGLEENCEWLAMLYGGCTTADDVRHQILKLEYHGLLEIVELPKIIRVHDLHKRMVEIGADACGPNALCKQVFQGSLSSETSCSQLAKFKFIHAWYFDHRDYDMMWKDLLDSDGWINLEVLWLTGHAYKQTPISDCSKIGRHLVALRILRLEGIINLQQLWGWEGVPNLVGLCLKGLASLRQVGKMGCLKKLESLEVSRCQELQVQVLVVHDAGDAHGSSLLHALELRPEMTAWLLKADDGLPNLRILKFMDNGYELKEVGPLFDACPSLQTLDLSSCRGLMSFPGGLIIHGGSSLRTLHLRGCKALNLIEESIYSLTALKELDLSYCKNLKRIPDLTSMPSLRILRAESCRPLEYVRLDKVGCSLQELNFWECQESWRDVHIDSWREVHLSYRQKVALLDPELVIKSRRPYMAPEELNFWECQKLWRELHRSLPYNLAPEDEQLLSLRGSAALRFCVFGAVQPFLQLRTLSLGFPLANSYTDLFSHLDLSALPLVEVLHLARFRTVQEMCLAHAVNLCDLLLMEFPQLKLLTGLGTHHLHLSKMSISWCGSLETILGLSLLPALRRLSLHHCDILVFAEPGVQRLPDGHLDLICGTGDVLELGEAEAGVQSCGLVSQVLYLWRSCTCGHQHVRHVTTGYEDGLVDETSSPLLPPSLRSLSLEKCDAIADLSCLGQGQRMLSLESLSVSDCKCLPDSETNTFIGTAWAQVDERG